MTLSAPRFPARIGMVVLAAVLFALLQSCSAVQGEKHGQSDMSRWEQPHRPSKPNAAAISRRFDRLVIKAHGPPTKLSLSNPSAGISGHMAARAQDGVAAVGSVLQGCSAEPCLVIALVGVPLAAGAGAVSGLVEAVREDAPEPGPPDGSDMAQPDRTSAFVRRDLNGALVEALYGQVNRGQPYALHVVPNAGSAAQAGNPPTTEGGDDVPRPAELRVGVAAVTFQRVLYSDVSDPKLVLKAVAKTSLFDPDSERDDFARTYAWTSRPQQLSDWLAHDARALQEALGAAVTKLGNRIARDYLYEQSYRFSLDLTRMPGAKTVKGLFSPVTVVHGNRICWKAATLPGSLSDAAYNKPNSSTPAPIYTIKVYFGLARPVLPDSQSSLPADYERTGLTDTCHAVQIENLDQRSMALVVLEEEIRQDYSRVILSNRHERLLEINFQPPL